MVVSSQHSEDVSLETIRADIIREVIEKIIPAELMDKEGFKVVAVSDISGGLYDPDGLDIPAIRKHLSVRGVTLETFPAGKAKRVSNSELLELPVDMLVPAALENQVNASNADRVQAKIIVEGANGPLSNEADEILDAKGVVIVPDILANAGGVVVSYFEWVQNIQSMDWSEEEVNSLQGCLGHLSGKEGYSSYRRIPHRCQAGGGCQEASWHLAVNHIA